ncbi:MAG TPA: ComC/BlpC family peptide pheromone/bacteriocin [Lactobacillus sp.]|nr:ComC/BlpC family leader-containing pheromone/bacteriocin [Ligilactobacillus murinus]HAB49835.1 ComC/BlpC family peptide pheromone/bacteriocin [Lactobacillus sp.]
MNNAKLNLFEELSTNDLQNIVGGKRGLGYHIVDAVVSFGKGFLDAF